MMPSRGVQKKPKPKTEPKNQKNRTEKPVNRKKFKKNLFTEPEKSFGFRFGYGSGGSKIRLTEPKLKFF